MTSDVEDRLRAAYAATSQLVDPDRIPTLRIAPRTRTEGPGSHSRQRRWLTPTAAAVTVLTTVMVAVTVARFMSWPAAGKSGASMTAPVTRSRTAPALSSSAAPKESAPPPSGIAKVGVSYRYQAYTHCGMFEIGKFDGRYWVPVPPLPTVPRPRPRPDGTTVDNGYTAGTLTLISPTTLRFAVDDSTVLTAGITVRYHPASASPPAGGGVCS